MGVWIERFTSVFNLMAHLLKPFNARRIQRHSDSILRRPSTPSWRFEFDEYARYCSLCHWVPHSQILNPFFALKTNKNVAQRICQNSTATHPHLEPASDSPHFREHSPKLRGEVSGEGHPYDHKVTFGRARRSVRRKLMILKYWLF